MARNGAIRKRKKRDRVIAQLVERDGDGCFYCAVDFGSGRRQLTIDHWLPRHAGGTNAVENLRLACTKCNGLKQAQSSEEFLRSVRLARRRATIAREPLGGSRDPDQPTTAISCHTS